MSTQTDTPTHNVRTSITDEPICHGDRPCEPTGVERIRDEAGSKGELRMKVVEVRWQDAWIDTNDIKIKKAKKLKPVIRSTVGYLVDDSGDRIVLCTDKFEKGKEVNASMVIPWGMVTDYWTYEDKD